MKTPRLLFAAASALALTSCAAVPPAVPVVPGALSVTTATKAPFGTYLVDGAGRSLYILEGEHMPGGTHRCVGQCMAVWPPLPGALAAGAGVDTTMLGTMTMGTSTHATYAGWPLYYYSHDRAPEDTTGQHVTDAWGTWHLLSPSGQPIRPAGAGY
jgi:predicted lipoprotein with Yx(FWY)xxD motif